MKEKRFTKQIHTIARSTILVGFGAFILTKVASEQITLFIHPRFIPLAIFTGVVLLLLALVEIRSLILSKSSGHGTLKATTAAIFIIPLLLGILFPPVSMDSAMARKKGGLSVAGPQKRQMSKESEANKQLVEKGVLEVTDENFISLVDEIVAEPEKMRGKLVKITGFIYKQKDFEKDHFAIVRFTVSCCTADAVLTGLVCRHEKSEKFKQDAWYEITGKMSTKEIESEVIPVLDVTKYRQVKALKDPYVYPDWYDPSIDKK